jgi:hypothetical protein
MIDSSSNPGSHGFACSHSQERKIAETRRHRSFTKLILFREFTRLTAKKYISSPHTPQGPEVGLCLVAIRKESNFGVTFRSQEIRPEPGSFGLWFGLLRTLATAFPQTLVSVSQVWSVDPTMIKMIQIRGKIAR